MPEIAFHVQIIQAVPGCSQLIPLFHSITGLQGPLVLKHLLSSKGLLHETKLWFKFSWSTLAGIGFVRENCHSPLIVVRETYIGLK